MLNGSVIAGTHNAHSNNLIAHDVTPFMLTFQVNYRVTCPGRPDILDWYRGSSDVGGITLTLANVIVVDR